jgi:GntR family transcriptional regulator
MEFDSKQPIYLQIAEKIIENILEEKWTGEDKIPSVRDLAMEVEVNPNTIMRTYSFLQDADIIYNKRGIGYFVSPEAFSIVKKIRKQEFINEELPHVFRTMELLDMGIDDIERQYAQYQTGM